MSSDKKLSILNELLDHYTIGKDEMKRRKTRHNGWDDIIRAYFGVLPENWPYLSMLVDPVIRTTLIEKNSRLLNGKLRGTLVPREGGDMLKARVNNAILDFQWDQATNGGSMIEKWSLMDTQARLFGASFGMTWWDSVDNTNEFKVLDNRDVFVDYGASSIKNANWTQVREWVGLDELERINKEVMTLKGLKDLKKAIADNDSFMGDRRDNNYTSPIKQSRGLEDLVGRDRSFPVIEIVREYRENQWLTFAPRYGVLVGDNKNPFKHKKIPVVMLRYYNVGDDVYGDSEVESVLPLQRAINSVLCGFIDHMNVTLRPPIKVANNSTVRRDTLKYGPDAIWLVGDSVNNVQTHQTGANQVISSFQSAYSVLKAAFNTAMGETSLGTSNIDPFSPDKTATEVQATEKQKLSRDQKNQIALEDALKDQMMMWVQNNQQFLFDDPSKKVLVQRIVGESLKDLTDAGLDSMEVSDDAVNQVAELIKQTNGQVGDEQIRELIEGTTTPKFPVITNPDEKDPEKFDIRPRLELDENGGSAMLNITPDDMEGVYDYIPSVKSMSISEGDRAIQGRNQALQLVTSPAVERALAQQGVSVDIKQVLSEVLEDSGVRNVDKLFTESSQQVGSPEQQTAPQQGNPQELGLGS